VWAEEVSVPTPGTGTGAFLGWVLLGAGIGAGFGLGVRVGLFVALGLLLVGGVLVARQGPRPAQLGVVTGLSALPFAIAWLQWGGRGELCTPTSPCGSETTPWLFVLVGVVLVVIGVGLFRRTRRSPVPPAGPRS
jgi:hypothetical protein